MRALGAGDETKTIAQLSGLKPIMLASSVQAVAATAPRGCTGNRILRG